VCFVPIVRLSFVCTKSTNYLCVYPQVESPSCQTKDYKIVILLKSLINLRFLYPSYFVHPKLKTPPQLACSHWVK